MTRSISPGGLEWLPPLRLLDDSDARARADARGSGGHHGLQRVQIADATRGLHSHLLTDNPSHERDIVRRRAARSETGRCLHEIGASRLRERTRGDLLLVRK